ncbi:MAG: rod shape-determining protein MreC [Candidatus Pacebacteria bacterium]|nr:rod shape-determining protein MreC [Candidatus Paceibacterota bacterium]
MKKEINKKIRDFIFLLVVIVLLIFLNKFGYLYQVKSFTAHSVNSISKIFQSTSNELGFFVDTLKSIDEFKNENMKLKKENLEMNYKILQLEEMKIENDILRKQLNFSQNSCFDENCLNLAMGDITGRGPDNFGDYIIVNLGKRQEIKEGYPVIASGGILIGKVVEVFESYSRIMLITDSESSINSITQKTRSNGISKGSYATGIKLEMINQSENLVEGDLVITSGLENKIPKGLVIGKISNIEEAANKIFKTAELELFVDFNKVEKVFIIKND